MFALTLWLCAVDLGSGSTTHCTGLLGEAGGGRFVVPSLYTWRWKWWRFMLIGSGVWNTESISDRANRGRISFIRNYAQQSSSVSRGKCREERTICGTNSNKFPLWCRSWHREDKKPSESNAQLRASPSQGRTKDIIPHTTYFDYVGTIWRGIEMYNSKELLRKRLRSPSKYHE